MLSVLTQFLSNLSQYVAIDGCISKLVNMVSREPTECFGSAVVPPVHRVTFIHSGSKLYVYADDSTFIAVVRFPGERIAVTESLNRDPKMVSM